AAFVAKTLKALLDGESGFATSFDEGSNTVFIRASSTTTQWAKEFAGQLDERDPDPGLDVFRLKGTNPASTAESLNTILVQTGSVGKTILEQPDVRCRSWGAVLSLNNPGAARTLTAVRTLSAILVNDCSAHVTAVEQVNGIILACPSGRTLRAVKETLRRLDLM